MTHYLSDDSWLKMTRDERLIYAALAETKAQTTHKVNLSPAQIASMNAFEKVMNNKYGHGCVAANQ